MKIHRPTSKWLLVGATATLLTVGGATMAFAAVGNASTPSHGARHAVSTNPPASSSGVNSPYTQTV